MLTPSTGDDAREGIPVRATPLPERDDPALTLDEHGILRYHDRWIALSAAEESAMSVLLGNLGKVVTRKELNQQIWPRGEPAPRSIDVLIYRLRKHVGPIGLNIATIRSRGFLLECARD